MDLGFDGSDNEAYQEDDDDEEADNNFDEFDITSQDSEERDKAFYGDEYTLLSQPTDEQQLMSMTMQQRQQKETLNRISLLKNDIDQIKYRVQQRVNEGQHLAGNKFDFN